MNTDEILTLKNLFMFFKYGMFFAFIRVHPWLINVLSMIV